MSGRRDSVQSVERAIDVIEALAEAGHVGVSELAQRTGLVPSTAHRLLATLAGRGYVVQDSRGRYGLGPRAAGLAARHERHAGMLRELARPHLRAVQRSTGETANLTVLDGDRIVYVDQVEGTRSVRMFTTIGATVAAHTTASGKAILAFDPDLVAELYEGGQELVALTPRTLTLLEDLRKDLRRTARRGYAIDDGEHEEGVSCVAAPVFDHTDRACAALSVSAPAARITQAGPARLGDLLRAHAEELAASLAAPAAGPAGRVRRPM